MKKILVAVLVSTLVCTVLIGTVDANPFVKTPAISIVCPSPWFVTCYQNASVPLIIEVDVLETSTSYSPLITSIVYSLDGKENITISNIAKGYEFAAGVDTKGISLIANTTLHDLAEGNHTLKAYSFDSNGQVLSAQTTFTVNSTYRSPQVTITSPLNKTYTTNSIPLIFSVSTEFEGPQYVLDIYNVGPIKGNTTILSNLSEGTHVIDVHADCFDKYWKGQTAGQIVQFSVDTTKATSSSAFDNQTVVTVLVSVIVIFLVTAGILVYWKKRKDRKQS
jgi:hypothetical protein